MTLDIDKRIQLAMEGRKKGYNCAQAVVTAFPDVLQLPQDVALRLACGFGGGFGGMQRVCGVLSAMTILEGFSAEDAVKGKPAVYKVVKHLGEEFEKACGSVECRELKAPGTGMPCNDIIENGIRIYHDYLLSK